MQERSADRRQNVVDYERRQFNRREREFLFRKTVYLTDTNATGNTYFTNYFDWQGMVREEFVRFIMPDWEAFFKSGIKLITLEASMKYYYESVLFDDLLIKMKIGELKKTNVELLFKFFHQKTGKLLSEGRQRIAFATASGRYIPVPTELILAAKNKIKDLPI
jgi:enediyne biosynthesis thioesterase